jgi:predicted O-methyltransferase YrrM
MTLARMLEAAATGIPGGWERLSRLDGWCSEKKARALCAIVAFARPNTCVEIGVFGGKSLFAIASVCYEYGGSVHGVDPWLKDEALVAVQEAENREWWSRIDLNVVYGKCVAALNSFGLQACCHLHRMTSEKAAPLFERVDLLHIDGNHSETQSTLDVKLWLPKVPSGGIVVFDDVDWPTTATARSMVEQECDRLVQVDNCAFFLKR